MRSYKQLLETLPNSPKTWLITGVAGFIGSNLLETLLKLNQRVVGLDNFATGKRENLTEVESLVAPSHWANFEFIQGDICQLKDCQRAMQWTQANSVKTTQGSSVAVDYVLHHAALGSVPRSLIDPIKTNATNIEGFLNILVAARDARVSSFTYAASSSTYGDHTALPKSEDNIGRPLSPYAVTKYVNELYAEVFSRNYGFSAVGLRYFNVFGPRQDPEGAYAAVIPKWTKSLLCNEPVFINGDGETSRDFTFVENAVQANLLAATTTDPIARNQIYNIAAGERTTLNTLYNLLKENILTIETSESRRIAIAVASATHRDFRAGDIRHSIADVSKAYRLLGYHPTHDLAKGIPLALAWYLAHDVRTVREIATK